IHFIDGKVGSTVAARGGPPAVHSKGIDNKEGVIDDKEETPGAHEGENGGSTLDYEAIFSALDVISSAPMDVMGTPQRIGDLEFDVEVDEKIPEKGQKAPEVDVEDDKNNPMGGDGQVLTDVSVDLMSKSAKRIGDIELDMNVLNARTRHPHHQKLEGSTNEEDDPNPNPNPDTSTNSTPVDNNQEPTNITTTVSINPADVSSTTPPPDTGANGGHSKKWALILICIVFICIAIVGLIWAFMKFKGINKTAIKPTEEKQIAAAGAANPPPAGQPLAEPPSITKRSQESLHTKPGSQEKVDQKPGSKEALGKKGSSEKTGEGAAAVNP
ncbi:unnamed protein product, partial [Oppiella nova]